MNKHPDADLIDGLGGPAEVARKMGYGEGGLQRVHNWTKRGIPAAVKLERPDLFLLQSDRREYDVGPPVFPSPIGDIPQGLRQGD